MGKDSHDGNSAKCRSDGHGMATSSPPIPVTVQNLRKDLALWYNLLVLIYDLQNVKQDKNAQDRLNSTIHERYLSAPYFTTVDEVAKIQGAVLDGVTVDEAITQRLENFFEKRKASGDARPCGPHDMVPAYLECFGIEKREIRDEGFVRRVRKHGLRS